MASKRQTAVKNKIQSVIGKYNHIVSSKPPFSNSELVVMAVLCLSAKKNVARKHDIYQWIIKNIKYYRDSALKEFARAAADETSPQYENVVEGLNDVFCSYEVPLSGVSDQTGPVHSNMVRLLPFSLFQTLLPQRLSSHGHRTTSPSPKTKDESFFETSYVGLQKADSASSTFLRKFAYASTR